MTTSWVEARSSVLLLPSGSCRGCFDRRRQMLRFPIDVRYCQRPQRHEVHCRHKLAEKRRQKLPVPSEKIAQRAGNSEIEHVIGGRCGAFDEERKDRDLQQVRDGCYRESCSYSRPRRYGKDIFGQSNSTCGQRTLQALLFPLSSMTVPEETYPHTGTDPTILSQAAPAIGNPAPANPVEVVLAKSE